MRFKFKGATKYGKRHVPGVMNQTESLYADILQARKLAGEIVEFWFESSTFTLARDCRYCPDFGILFLDGSMEFVDVKGSGPIDDKSIVKIKCAAEKFFQYRFVMEQRQTKKCGGGWKRKEF